MNVIDARKYGTALLKSRKDTMTDAAIAMACWNSMKITIMAIIHYLPGYSKNAACIFSFKRFLRQKTQIYPEKEKMKIIIDTNFLIYASKYKIDLAAELYRLYGKYEIILPRTVFIEVQKLEKSRGNGKFTAKLALIIIKKLLEDKRLKIIGTDSKNADEEIIRLLGMPEIKKEKIIVGTMDRELADRIKKRAGILKIRQKRYLSE